MKKYETPIVTLEIFGVRDVVSASKPPSEPTYDPNDPANDSNWTDFY